MGSRRRARECALQILVGLDWSGHAPDAAIEHYWSLFAGERPAAFEDIHQTSSRLVRGVVAHRDEIDARLVRSSHNWRLERMSVVDRNILRMAIYELEHRPERVPWKVVLNEAIEIAKKFGSDDSSMFINGVLHPIAQETLGKRGGRGGRPRSPRAVSSAKSPSGSGGADPAGS
jgi:N utilization substance protein B